MDDDWSIGGRLVGHGRREAPNDELLRFTRQLLAAVVWQAVEDAQHGCDEAVRFMEDEAPGILAVLGMPGSRACLWRQADLSELKHTVGVGCEENKRRSVERRRERRLYRRLPKRVKR